MDDDLDFHFARSFPGGFTIRDEAKALVACALRNGPIERLHAGKYSELVENPDLSRITDAEMKELMINASETLAHLLTMREKEPAEYLRKMKRMCLDYCTNWKR